MAKRDTDTELWAEDWFIDLKGRHQLFYFYIKDRCDQAGFWRPNFKTFEQITGFRINPNKFLDEINSDYSTGEKMFRERIKVLENGRWWIVNFISFHFPTLNLQNRFHRSVYQTFSKNVTCENTIEYGFEVKDTSKTPQEEVKREERDVSSSLLNNKKDHTFIPPTFEEFEKYCSENNHKNIASRSFKGYSEANWYDSKGKKIKNWKQKLQHVWFREDNKDPEKPKPSNNHPDISIIKSKLVKQLGPEYNYPENDDYLSWELLYDTHFGG